MAARRSTSALPPTLSLKARHLAETRAALISSARALFAEKGYAAASITEIVDGAQLTRGALYYHFAGKDELFEAVFEEVEAELQERSRAAARNGTTALARVRHGFDAYLDAA